MPQAQDLLNDVVTTQKPEMQNFSSNWKGQQFQKFKKTGMYSQKWQTFLSPSKLYNCSNETV